MNIFKLIEIDLISERKRINKKGLFTKKQREALLDLCELFEAGEWQKCLDMVNNEKAFPYNKKGEYPEAEHIGRDMVNVISNLGVYNFYTQEQLLEEADCRFLHRKTK